MRVRSVALAVAVAIGESAAVFATACLFDVPELRPAQDGATLQDGDARSEEPLADARADVTSPNGCPPGMIRTTRLCIDATEVTGKAYYAFVREATMSGRKSSHPRCDFLTTWQPGTKGGLPGEDDLPIVNVSWCHAYEYCAFVGKRLCGRLEGGGALLPDELSTPDHDEWYIACAGGIGQVYEYGSTYQDGACNVRGVGREPVASRPACQGASLGLFDMSGNVCEWFDACQEQDGGGGSDSCSIRAPGWIDFGIGAELQSQCVRLDGTGRESIQPYIGFRCCATPAQ
jgi:formylglycine-generating enzyme required for sulfatase activity